MGYLARIPSVVIGEGVFGSTVVDVTARGATGDVKVATRGRLVEGLYTNRAFIAGVGSVPSTNPTSFAGASSLLLGPPLWYRALDGVLKFELSGLLTFAEAIAKGILGRLLHTLGLSAGGLAGGGRFSAAKPENQIILTEGESVELAFTDPKGRPRAVPTQVSGDPAQASTMTVRVAWGPLPLLAAPDSLLFGAAQRALTRLRQLQTFPLQTVYIGGLPFFRHRVGPEGSGSGVPGPLRTLPRRLLNAQRVVVEHLAAHAVGDFIDTTEVGSRRVRHAHSSDQRGASGARQGAWNPPREGGSPGGGRCGGGAASDLSAGMGWLDSARPRGASLARPRAAPDSRGRTLLPRRGCLSPGGSGVLCRDRPCGARRSP